MYICTYLWCVRDLQVFEDVIHRISEVALQADGKDGVVIKPSSYESFKHKKTVSERLCNLLCCCCWCQPKWSSEDEDEEDDDFPQKSADLTGAATVWRKAPVK